MPDFAPVIESIAPAAPATASRRPRAVVALVLFLVAAATVGGVVVAFVPRNGQPLPDVERVRLLEQAGLPEDFPVHPFARRMTQPAQGGFSYTLNEPVPDVLSWQRDSLLRGGYEVFNADVEGQDEYLPHWLYFKGGGGTTGAIIIRSRGIGAFSATEVKILSTADARLAPPPIPGGAGGAGGVGR